MRKLMRLVVGQILMLAALLVWSPVIWAAMMDLASPPSAAATASAAPPSPTVYSAPAAGATPMAYAAPAAHATQAASPPRAATLICDATGTRCVGANTSATPHGENADSASTGKFGPGPRVARPSPSVDTPTLPVAAPIVSTNTGFTNGAAGMSPVTPSTSSERNVVPAARPTPVVDAVPAANLKAAAQRTPVADVPSATFVCDASGKKCVAVTNPAVGAPSSTTPVPPVLAALHPPVAAATYHVNPLHDHLTEGQELFYRTNDESVLNAASWSVMMYESRHLLTVYFKGHLFENYRAVFGRSLKPGGKLYEGDRRTPQGVYHIIAKHRSYRWRYFLKLDYPNNIDRIHFGELRADGMIPERFREGGEIGIHGTDQPLLNEGLVNWTTGCISIDSSAIVDLARLLPIGTLVIINP